MTQEERDLILLDLKKGQEELLGRVGNLENGQEELLGRVVCLENGLKYTNQELERLSQSVAKIEVDNGEKIQILLDVVTSHSKRFDSIDQRLESIETKVDRHSDEIYYLNSKVHAF